MVAFCLVVACGRLHCLPVACGYCFCFFFFNDTATTEIYTLSLHDALPILVFGIATIIWRHSRPEEPEGPRSEEHTSELQSRPHLVCRLLLEKKKHTQT